MLESISRPHTYPPLIHPARWPLPVLGSPSLVRVVHLLYLCGVLDHQIKRPDKVIEVLRERIELFHGRLYRVGSSSLDRLQVNVSQLRERLCRALPVEKVVQHRMVVDSLGGRLLVGAQRSVEDSRTRIIGLGLRLDSLNPQRVLERGYSILRSRGKNVRSIAEVVSGDSIDITVSDGLVLGTVTSCSKER